MHEQEAPFLCGTEHWLPPDVAGSIGMRVAHLLGFLPVHQYRVRTALLRDARCMPLG